MVPRYIIITMYLHIIVFLPNKFFSFAVYHHVKKIYIFVILYLYTIAVYKMVSYGGGIFRFVTRDFAIFRVGFCVPGEFAFYKSMSSEESFCAGRGGCQAMRNIQRYKKGGSQTSANDTRSAATTPLSTSTF